MRNPFQYSGIVLDESFCNREQETTDLLRAIENGEKLFVYSERRLGKTSLIQTVFRRLPRSNAAAYVDLWPTDGFAGLSVEETARVLEVSERTVKRDWRKARAYLYRALGARSRRSEARTSDPSKMSRGRFAYYGRE